MENLNQDTIGIQQSNVTYQDYYMRAMNQQLHSDEFGGLKLVVGPTGLGKTYAIPFVIQELRQRGVDKGYIYCTHRHMLLEEMQRDLHKEGIPSIYLKKNTQVVTNFPVLPALAKQELF